MNRPVAVKAGRGPTHSFLGGNRFQAGSGTPDRNLQRRHHRLDDFLLSGSPELAFRLHDDPVCQDVAGQVLHVVGQHEAPAARRGH